MRLRTSAIVIFLITLVQYSNAQGPTEPPRVSPAVLALAKAGVSQQLLVNLNAVHVLSRLQERSRPADSSLSTKEEVDSMAREFAQIKSSLFPGGRLGKNRIVQDFSHLPTVLVEVPDLESLVLLVKQPQVQSVHENQSFRPPGA
jgi:hypothetical protein